MEEKPKRTIWRALRLFTLLLIIGGYCFWVLSQPLSTLKPELSSVTLSTQTLSGNLPWPAYGQAAVGVLGADVVAQHGKQTPVPIASVAKVITSLAVLQKKPLKLGEQGPAIKLGATDTALYNAYVAKEGSVTPVNNGESITEYQMLQAVLLPSANNIADSMAIWAFGSVKAYTDFATSYIKQIGLINTKIGDDASGYAPTTTSTTRDLVKLGQAAMANPVIAEIVATPDTTDVPVAGRIYNVNSLLGTNGIVGIKTGNTLQAGGVFLGASKTTINKKPVTVITAIAGAPNLDTALTDTLPLTQAAQKNFDDTTLIGSNAVVGSYRQPWGNAPVAVAPRELSVLSWKGLAVPITVTLRPISFNAKADDVVGTITAEKSLLAGTKSIDAVLQSAPTKPSVWWRLLHPLYR
jgi:D-alanyl-D-alanine carboxypeptidase (penicillin-binding protein 5/6)